MLISWSDSRFWRKPTRKKIEISPTTRIDLPRLNRIVVESLKAAIRLGRQLRQIFFTYFTYGDGSSTEDFFYKLNTLWKLCVVVGAGICEPHNFASEEVAATWMKDAENIHKLFLDIERRVNSHILQDLGTSRTQFARLMDQLLDTHEKDLDIMISNMTDWNFELNAKPLSGEDGLKS
jgi:hypothetical protein